MTPLGKNRPPLLRSIVRDVLVLVLAEALVLVLAWCLSRKGKSILAWLFRTKRRGSGNNMTTPTTIDV